jgi:hypothetical protein
VADMKAVGQQTAAGNAKSNVPIPSNTHQPFPSSTVPGGIPTLDTAKFAPTTGPCAADERPDMAQVHLEIDRDKTRQ